MVRLFALLALALPLAAQLQVPTTPPVNVSQFGGNAVATGTGAGGAGIPRVTVSNDSNVLATQSGPWTVQPGNTANTTAWLVKPNDGSNSLTIKAASTVSVAADTSIVVQENPLAVDTCTSFIAVNQTTSTQVITGTASQKIHICSILLVSATAQSIGFLEGTGTTCASTQTAVIGGVAGTVAVAANGGFAMTAARPWFIGKTAQDNYCVMQTGAGNVSGVITYVSQ